MAPRHFKCPTSVEFREGLPRTAAGRVQKFLFRAELNRGAARAYR